MTAKWSKGATQRWEEFAAAVRASLRDSESDPDEVLQDLRLHAEEDFRDEAVVTADHVGAFVARIDFPTANPPPGEAPASAADQPESADARSEPPLIHRGLRPNELSPG